MSSSYNTLLMRYNKHLTLYTDTRGWTKSLVGPEQRG